MNKATSDLIKKAEDARERTYSMELKCFYKRMIQWLKDAN